VSADDDRADVERVLAGDTSAFEGIVRRWQGPLVNLAWRFCHDRGRAEDMAQEAFLRAYRGLSQWRRDAAFSTWLFALATNLYRTELRRIPARSQPLDAIPEPGVGATAHARLEETARDRVIRRAVDLLLPRYREPMVLFYFHDRDLTTVANGLQLPVGTVKARLSRGRELLKKKLDALFDRKE